MPFESLLMTTAVVAFFTFFAAVLLFTDLTWERVGKGD
jgi:hypothetical protein